MLCRTSITKVFQSKKSIGAFNSCRRGFPQILYQLWSKDGPLWQFAWKALQRLFLCHFLWRTGCRISEALNVSVADLDLVNKVVHIQTLKRKNHVRFVPLQTEFIGEIAIWINQNQLGRMDKLFPIGRKTGLPLLVKTHSRTMNVITHIHSDITLL